MTISVTEQATEEISDPDDEFSRLADCFDHINRLLYRDALE